jgi:hypothetical protein
MSTQFNYEQQQNQEGTSGTSQNIRMLLAYQQLHTHPEG